MTAVPSSGFPGHVQAIVQKFRHVSRLHYFEVLASTNSTALDLARGGAPHGTLVLADAQEAGRGRHGRGWSSPPGVGLWVSWILRPELPANRAFLITWAAANAIAETAARVAGVPAMIKWPNDVLIRGRKVCGLLTEVGSRGDSLDYLVLGTGLNVNQTESDFPADLQGQATSLRISCNRVLDRALTLATYIEAFEFEYDRLLKDGGTAVRRDWTDRSNVIGKQVLVHRNGGSFTGRATGVAEDGALLVEQEGTVQAVHSADIDLLRVRE